MTQDELIKSAKDIIGQGHRDDYILAPREHSKSLADQAPALSAILEREQLTAAVEQYEYHDAAAKTAQEVFRATSSRANVGVFVTVCLTAAILVTELLAPSSLGKALLISFSICSVFGGALASMWLFKIRGGLMLEKWMAARAVAETMRLSYFLLVINARVAGDSAIPVPLLQLEYFRRYQLDIERAYYRNRTREHQDAANKILGISAFSVLLASLAAGLGGLLGGALAPRWVSIAALGTVAAALSSFAAAQEALGQDRRNAERYGRTLAALDDLASRIGDVRASAAAGMQEPVQAFVAAVHEQLSLEHRQWLDNAESTKASLATLEQALRNAHLKSSTNAESK